MRRAGPGIVALAGCIAGCGAESLPVPAPDPRHLASSIDWARAGVEASEVLRGYLKVDTMTPAGHEGDGAHYLEAVLAHEGIPSELVDLAPGRASLIARLPGSGAEPPLCLLSHIDVVGADARDWPAATGPLSGALDPAGMIWGRGALDMKGMATIELLTLVWLKRLGVPLKREVILLAVADEEQGNGGMKQLVDQHWQRIGCSHVINEGGLGLAGLFFADQAVMPVSVVEKGVLWLRLTVQGADGHGSTPRAEHTPRRLVEILSRIDQRAPRVRFHPALELLFRRAGHAHGGLKALALAHPGLAKGLLAGELLANPLARAAVTDTVTLTRIEAPSPAPNVVGSTASAIFDCRLLPGTPPAQLIDELNRLAGTPVKIETLAYEPSYETPFIGDPLFEAIEAQTRIEWPGIVVGPALSVGFSDSLYARRAGARAFGFVPFVVSAAEAATMHGHDERVSGENLQRGLRVLVETVLRVAAR